MELELKNQLLKIVKQKQTKTDPAHDFNHVIRVVNLAQLLAISVRADLQIALAAAAFHDIVIYPKDSKESVNETDESAMLASEILRQVDNFPNRKIPKVASCIRECSFTKNLEPSSLESAVLQDADRLEATGAIAIMRTFSSCGQMNRPFYPFEDPLCEAGTMEHRSGIDLFFQRLLVVESMMHTELGKKISERRTKFLKYFLETLKVELFESGVYD